MNMPEQQTRTAPGAPRTVSRRHSCLGSATLATLLLVLWTLAPAAAAPAHALSFDGVNDYVETPTAVIPTAGDFTVECWVACPTAPNSYRELLSQGSAGNAFYIGTDTANSFRVGDTWGGTGVAFPLGGWHHVAVVKSSTNTLLYLDGTNRLARGSAIANPAAFVLRFGQQYGSGGEYWPGSLGDVRIWKKALSAAEVSASRSNSLSGAETNLVAAWLFQEGAGTNCTSIGASHVIGTLNNGPLWKTPSSNFALTFDGVDDYVETSTGVIPSSGDFTVAFWAQAPTAPSSHREILSQGSSGNGLYIGTDPSNNLRLGDSWGPVSPAIPFPVGGWHHFTLVKTASDTIFYLDGTNRLSRGAAIANPAASTGLRLGRQFSSSGGEYWPGSVDEVAIWSKALSAAEVRASLGQIITGTESNLLAYWSFNDLTCVAQGGTNVVGLLVNGPTWTAGVVVAPSNVPPTIVSQPTNVTALAGSAVAMSVSADGSLPLSYQWYWQNHGVLAGATNATLAWSSLAGSNAGAYYVVVSNAYSTATSQQARVAALTWQLNGANPMTNLLHTPFTDPGATLTTPVVAVAAGRLHSLAGLADGTVVGWGFNGSGQTNVPASATNVVALAAGYCHSLALKADGTVVGWGNNDYVQTNVPASATNVVALAAGHYHSLALKADGTIVGWGWDLDGQTDVPATATNVVALAAGAEHSLALKADGTVVGWGDNYYRQTIVPASATNVVALAAAYSHSLALKADGTIVGWGDSQTNVPATATNVVAVAAGMFHSQALRADGSVVAWGDNGNGQTNVPSFGQTILATSGTVDTNVAGACTLTYRFTNSLGSVASTNRTVVVIVPVPPTIVRQPQGLIVLWGAAAGFQVAATGSAPLSYRWQKEGVNLTDGVNLSGTASTNLALGFTSTNLGGNYTVIVTNLGGSVTSRVARLAVAALNNLLVNGGFETGDFAGWINSGHIHVDYLPAGWYSGTHGAVVDAGGSGSISQTFSTRPGTAYLISCEIYDASYFGCTVIWNGTTAFNQTFNPPGGWLYLQIPVVATAGSTELSFSITTDPFAPCNLDDISVLPALPAGPAVQPSVTSNGSLQLSWPPLDSAPPVSYQVQTSTNLSSTNWLDLGSVVPGGTGTLSVTNPLGSDPQRLYRLLLVP